MLKLIRFIGLVSQSIMIQFAHLFGLVAFVAGAALGYFRLPSWAVPILAVVCGVLSDKFLDEESVTGLLEKAHSANQRGGFLIVVYFVICALGYVVGAYGRHYQRKRVTAAATKE
ncbi:hypothetical protein OGR47_08670 [Methylocystis sp. MJC1]|jgi:hypothetical protein|uniref:hypothetical protein n=1 Tax=Methylocystis sp. MJC1 TaxID=2654282 RepID=UPI0013EC308A|nr:hypothetical protein [Methylocystis sp. MJC1]KAF2991702.1 hypothetical protein MJC1_01267 [Methylocystis sp. MJC1]MBU6527059.1 hypothetical protein [Methylocystis sp. MJC1]UZX13496.1 hypothetical protein OGR47_08670 [Methylocystis sp. MJC1]